MHNNMFKRCVKSELPELTKSGSPFYSALCTCKILAMSYSIYYEQYLYGEYNMKISLYASSIYTYEGNQFVEFNDGPGIPGSYDTSMGVNGFFELLNPLSLNTNAIDIAHLVHDYEFTDGRNLLDPSNSYIHLFSVSTNGTGILYWSMDFRLNGYDNLGYNDSTVRIITRTGTNFPLGNNNIFDQGITYTCLEHNCSGVNILKGVYDDGAVIVNAGSWSESISPVPLPPALVLFVSGIFCIIGFNKRYRS